MPTNNKNFIVKNGLTILGIQAKVNGFDIITKSAAGQEYVLSLSGPDAKIYSDQIMALEVINRNAAIVIAIDALTTDQIEQGSTNKYYIDPGTTPAPTQINYLGTANAYCVGGSTITTAGATTANGGVAAFSTTSITGVAFGNPRNNANATSAQVAADATAAYNTFMGMTPTGAMFATAGGAPIAGSPYIAGDLIGITFRPGVYRAEAAVTNSGVITLDAQNNPAATFIFQLGAAWAPAASTSFSLINGATSGMVYFNCVGATTIGASAQWTGTILSPAAIGLGASATVNGRLLTWSGAVTLSANTITIPS